MAAWEQDQIQYFLPQAADSTLLGTRAVAPDQAAPLGATGLQGPSPHGGRRAQCLRAGAGHTEEGGSQLWPWLGRLLGATLCTQQGRLTFPHKQLLAALQELAARTAPLSHAGPQLPGGPRTLEGEVKLRNWPLALLSTSPR